MNDVRVSRAALIAAAVASGVFYGTAAVSIGVPPSGDWTGVDVVAWLVAQQYAVRMYVLASALNTPVLAFLVAYLRGLLPPVYRDVFFAGALIILVTTSVQSWTFGGLALHPRELDPAIARAVLAVGIYWGPVLTGATVTMMAPAVWLALRGGAFPRWLGIVGVVAIAEQLAETITIFGGTGFVSPGGAMNLQLGAGAVAIWLSCFIVWAISRAE